MVNIPPDDVMECPSCYEITLEAVRVIPSENGRRDMEYWCECGYTEIHRGETPCQ